MEQQPTRKRPVGSLPRADSGAPPIEAGTLAERMEATRLQVEALEREVAGVIVDCREGAEETTWGPREAREIAMSKAKKSAYAARQSAAADATSPPSPSPVPHDGQPSKTKKVKPRKQSRGK